MKIQDFNRYEIIVLYGAGTNAKYFYECLTQQGGYSGNILVWDNFPNGKTVAGIFATLPEFSCLHEKNAAVLITTTVTRNLQEMIESVQNYLPAFSPYNIEEFDINDINRHDELSEVNSVGYCPVCQTSNVTFFLHTDFIGGSRNGLCCSNCESIPRMRAIVDTLDTIFTGWRKKKIHETAPASLKWIKRFQEMCANYSYSFFFSDTPPGSFKDDIRCENLESMTFSDESFDIWITQDVFEHILNPAYAFREISRVLRKGGIHIFTIPFSYQNGQTRFRCLERGGGNIFFLEEPLYHLNSNCAGSSLVTIDWGTDITDFIYQASGMLTMIYKNPKTNIGVKPELPYFISYKL